MDAEHLTRFRLVASSGSVLTTCSLSCLRVLRKVATVFATFDVDTRPTSPTRSCVHCAWCGDLVAVPVRCYLHEDCPPFRWQLAHIGPLAVWEVAHRTGQEVLAPRAFAAFDEVAARLRESGAFPDIDRLVAGVLDRRVDWLPPGT